MTSTDITLVKKDTLINVSLARAVVVVKNMGKAPRTPRRCYLMENGGWTTDVTQAKRFHNFRTAIVIQKAVRGDDVCLHK